MGNIRNASIIVFIVAVLLVAAAFWNYEVNISPKFRYLSETKNWLRQAEKESAFESKIDAIGKALDIYKTGFSQQHLEGLQSLISSETVEEIDYWLPKLISEVEAEHEGMTFTFKGLAMAVLLFGLILGSGWGTFKESDNWDTDAKQIYIAVMFALGLALLVGFLP